jgi:hypothetical protein
MTSGAINNVHISNFEGVTTLKNFEDMKINSQRSIGSYESENDFNIDLLQKQN